MKIMTQSNPYEPVKLVSPSTTTNRQSQLDAKMLTLKNLKPAKQFMSNIVTPKYKCAPVGEKQFIMDDKNLNFEDSTEAKNP